MNAVMMDNSLGLRLESPDGNDFTSSMKMKTLNNAQSYLAQKLNKEYLTELQVADETKTATAGVYTLSSLTYDVLGGAQGILAVKINDGKWCTRHDLSEIKDTENFYLAGSENNPLYYVYKDQIYVTNGQTNPVIDIYYLKNPTTMEGVYDISALGSPATTGFLGDDSQYLSAIDDTYNGALVHSINQDSYHVVTDYTGATRTFVISPAADANFGDDEIEFITHDFDTLSIGPSATDADAYVETCVLNKSLHELVVTLAEAECWAMDAQLDRKDAAVTQAELIIKTLNDRVEKRKGMGTKGN